MESFWLDKKCSDNKCQNLVKYVCSCPGNLVFCEIHSTPHFMKIRCHLKEIDAVRKILLIKSAKKALDTITSKMVERGEDLIKEINKTIKQNVDFIENIKSKLQSQDDSLDLESTINWARNFNFKLDGMHAFSSYSSYLLSVNGDSDVIEIRLKKDQELIEYGKKYADACEEKSLLEQKISEALKNYELQASEKKVLEGKCMSMAEAVNKLESQLNNYKEYEEELKKVSETNPTLKQILQVVSDNRTRRENIGKSETELFRSANQAQRAELLVKQDYQGFKDRFVDRKFSLLNLSLTNDCKSIFVCKD